jgi:hypothetical protein
MHPYLPYGHVYLVEAAGRRICQRNAERASTTAATAATAAATDHKHR